MEDSLILRDNRYIAMIAAAKQLLSSESRDAEGGVKGWREGAACWGPSGPGPICNHCTTHVCPHAPVPARVGAASGRVGARCAIQVSRGGRPLHLQVRRLGVSGPAPRAAQRSGDDQRNSAASHALITQTSTCGSDGSGSPAQGRCRVHTAQWLRNSHKAGVAK